jgi:hypothetical protein
VYEHGEKEVLCIFGEGDCRPDKVHWEATFKSWGYFSGNEGREYFLLMGLVLVGSLDERSGMYLIEILGCSMMPSMIPRSRSYKTIKSNRT